MKNQPTKSAEPRVIKNKDILLLSRVLYIMQDVCRTTVLRDTAPTSI